MFASFELWMLMLWFWCLKGAQLHTPWMFIDRYICVTSWFCASCFWYCDRKLRARWLDNTWHVHCVQPDTKNCLDCDKLMQQNMKMDLKVLKASSSCCNQFSCWLHSKVDLLYQCCHGDVVHSKCFLCWS